MSLWYITFMGLAMSLSCSGAFGQSQPGWKIEALSLHPDTDPPHRLPDGSAPNEITIIVSNRESGVRFNLSATVRLTAIKESFISGNKFVAVDAGYNAAVVVIFDLLGRQLIDWFYCDAPRRVSNDWIAYVEWYQAHGLANPREVLLVYDLTRTPAENRLPSAQRLPIPASIANGPTQVGFPIYPESNVRQKSYVNIGQSATERDIVLQNPGYVLLASKQLVFAAAQAKDFSSRLRNWLVIVDLSRRPSAPVINIIDIPRDQLKRSGENPDFIRITGIELLSEHAVRLSVTPSEYGVSSIVVSLPSR